MTGGVCPNCQAVNDQFTGVNTATPKVAPQKDDVSICWSCGSVNIYTGEGVEVRCPTPEEIEDLLHNPTVMGVRGSILSELAFK